MSDVRRIVPRARPAVTGVAVLISVLWIAVAVLAVRELAVGQGWAQGQPWLPGVLDALDGRRADVVTVVVGAVLVLLGLVVLLLALKPGRPTHLATTTEADLWITRGALAALVNATVDRQPGVLSVSTQPTRRRVAVHVVTRGDRAGLEQRVRAVLGERLDPLTPQRIDLDVTEVAR